VNLGFIDGHMESRGPKEIEYLQRPTSREHFFDTSKP
jgi:hypothetical protein